jgi:hypothetical protein
LAICTVIDPRFSHDGSAAGEKQKGVSQFGNKTSLEQYWQFVVLPPAFMFSLDGLTAEVEQKEFCNETSHEQYWQFVVLLTPAFTFSHDGLAAREEKKGVSQFGNETLHEQY